MKKSAIYIILIAATLFVENNVYGVACTSGGAVLWNNQTAVPTGTVMYIAFGGGYRQYAVSEVTSTSALLSDPNSRCDPEYWDWQGGGGTGCHGTNYKAWDFVGACTLCTNGTVNAGGGLAAICQSATSAVMGGSIGGGATVGTWSGGAGTWANATNPATATYTAGAGETGNITLTLTATGGCATVAATKTIAVNATSVIGSPSTAGPVNFCSAAGNFGSAVTVSGQTGSVVWNWGSNNGGWSATWASGTSSGINTFPKKISSSDGTPDRIRYKVTNGVCPTVTSGTILISNYHNVAASSITSNINNVCASTAGTLTATFPNAVNMRGTVEFATSLNGAAFATKAVSAGQTVFTTSVNPASTTTYYVRYNGISGGGASCYSTSQSVTVTITAVRTVAAPSSSQTLCISTAMTAITHATSGVTAVGTSSGLPNGVSASYSGNVLTISGTPTQSGTFNYTITPTSSCGAATATGTIIVDAAAVGGSITASASGCFGSNGATLTLSGHTTTITKWQKNENGGGWTDIGNAGLTTFTYSNLSVTTQYRAVIANGTCSANSSDATITVYADLTSGTIGTAQTISVGSTPTTLTETVAPVGGDGTYTYQWQSSTDGTSFTNINLATIATYSPGALSFDTWYRRIITSGSSCGSETSNIVKVSVNKYVCSGGTISEISSGVDASGGGGGGATYTWESSVDGTTFNTVASETGSTLSPSGVSQNTWYRRVATINGCSAYSNTLKGTVTGGSPGGISSGLLVWLKADAGTGSIGTQWEDQSGNGNHYSTVSGPTLVSAGDSSSNFNPYIQITSGGFTAPTVAQLGANYTIIAAAKKLASDNNGRLFDGRISSYDFAFGGTSTVKGIEVVTSSTLPASGVHVDINQGFTAAQGCHSHVYELIIYNTVLSTSEINVVRSYLETKYGVENGSNNYLTSAGGTTYNVAVGPAYVNDIIGIGKECYFHQKQSESVDDSVKIYLSALASTNSANAGSVTNDISYLMIGHDNGLNKATAASNAEVPAAPVNGYTVNSRLAREWKVTNTNFADNYTIKITVIDQSKITDFADLCLLIDDDGDFTNCNVVAANEGITFVSGSIVINGLGAGFIGVGATKFITIGTKDPDSTLPVELLSFSAEKSSDGVITSWKTAAEINNDYFVVEKSDDGNDWIPIGSVKGAGNSTYIIDYSFTDYEGCESTCYYRLAQTDFDGTTKYSEVEMVENTNSSVTELIIYPVPVAESSTVRFRAPSTDFYTLQIMNVIGALVYEAKVVCAEGENSFDINTSTYVPGIYYLIIRDNTGVIMGKVNFAK